MNKDFILQDMIDSQRGIKPKRNKTSTNQIQLHIASVYDDLVNIIQERNLQIKLPRDVPTAIQRINLLKNLIQYLIEKQPQSVKIQGGQQLQCVQCSNYEASLQKLQNQIRQHIRVQQQLKLYHDSLQQKLEQGKKEKKDLEKKLQSQKKHYDEIKAFSTTNNQKYNKLEIQNQKLKGQIKLIRGTKIDQSKKNPRNTIQGKQNRDWIHRNISLKKDQKNETRKSVQKKQQSIEKWRGSINHRSTKGFAMNEKLIQQKNRQQRKRVLQSKFQYRR